MFFFQSHFRESFLLIILKVENIENNGRFPSPLRGSFLLMITLIYHL